MSDANEKKRMRMAGTPLRMVARLIELPATGNLLTRVVMRQLGLDLLQQVDIPADVPPFYFRHLRRSELAGAAEENQ